MSTISIEMPRWRATLSSVRASTPHQRANWPQETHVFWPLRTKWSSCSTARVRSDARSEPASGSEKPWHQISSAERIARDVPPPLLVVAEAQQRRTEDVEPDDVDELGGAGGGELLVDDDLLDGRAAAAAELLRPGAADVAGLVAGRLPAAQRFDPLVQALGQVGRRHALVCEERADLGLQRALFIGGSQLHRTEIVSVRISGSRCRSRRVAKSLANY